MSKAHDPHWRYVAFRMEGATVTRRALGNAIKGIFRKAGWPDEELPQLTRFHWPHAIVKVHHFRLAETRELLPTVTWAVEAAAKVAFTTETLSSSGTIKSLTDRLGILQDRGPGPEKPPKPVKTPVSPPPKRSGVPPGGPAPPPGRRR